MQQPSLNETASRYYFSRVKDTRIGDGEEIFTLFARLTIGTPTSSTCIWADIKEIACHRASPQLTAMESGICTYQVPEAVFWELEQTSQDWQNELYSLIPLHRTMMFRQLAKAVSITE